MVWPLVLAAYPLQELGKVLTRSMRSDGGVGGEDKKQQKGKRETRRKRQRET